MKNILLKIVVLHLFLLSSTLTFGQEREAYEKVAVKFEKLYNAGKYDQIFELFSPQMKSALPIKKTTGFLSGLGSQAGKINSREFLKFEQGTYASYKTTFEKATLLLNISLDTKNEINGLLVKPYAPAKTTAMERNITKMKLPFKGEWTVFWGGDTEAENYHVKSPAQKGAFDMIITDKEGNSYTGNGTRNEDYYAFGKELIAPCDGIVEMVVDGIPDNQPGQMNPVYVSGNTVVIKTANNEYLLFGHFKQNSITVKQGQTVKQGDLLGLCGNSGNSTEAHLHFHIQNVAEMQNAIGAKCYFSNILVNGSLQAESSPVKGDRVSNQ